MFVIERGNPAPFIMARGPVGCLLLHGFPASPAELRPLGESLAEKGITVSAPLLPGFGTIPEDLSSVRWRDWVAGAEAALWHLHRSCSTLFLGGLSMGGALALYLAAHPPLPLAGVIALVPALRPRSRAFPWLHLIGLVKPWVEPRREPDDLADPQARALTWHYRRYPTRAGAQVLDLVRATRRSLHQVHLPVLIIQGRRDGSLDPNEAYRACQQIPATDKTLVWLERSGHNIAVDVEQKEVQAQIYRFICRQMKEGG